MKVQVIGQGAVAGSGGALLRDIIQRRVVAAIGGTGIPAGAEHVDTGDVMAAGERRDSRFVLDGPHQRLVIPDRHHDIRKAGGDDPRLQTLGAVILRQAVGGVQLRPLLLRQLAQQLGRRHIHPHRIAGDLHGQVGGLRMGGVAAVRQQSLPPQQGKRGYRGMAAQVHFPGRREVPQRDAAVLVDGDKRGFRVLELRGDLSHRPVIQRAVRQYHARLIAAENPLGERIHDISSHRSVPSAQMEYFCLYSS